MADSNRNKTVNKIHGNVKHGGYQNGRPTVEMNSYKQAQARCNNKNNPAYKDYGGRGIQFRFTHFSDFFTELGSRPSPGHTLNRKDNDGHYEPGNVEWATRKEQNTNRRNVLMVERNGVVRPLIEWCEILGLPHKTVYYRITRYGWSIDKALSTPVLKTWNRRGGRSCK